MDFLFYVFLHCYCCGYWYFKRLFVNIAFRDRQKADFEPSKKSLNGMSSIGGLGRFFETARTAWWSTRTKNSKKILNCRCPKSHRVQTWNVRAQGEKTHHHTHHTPHSPPKPTPPHPHTPPTHLPTPHTHSRITEVLRHLKRDGF
jgi:hypothetical protein